MTNYVQGLIETIISLKEIVVPVVTAIITIIYVYTFKMFIEKTKERKAERKLNFFVALSNGLEKGSVENIQDTINLYKGIMDISSEDLTYRAGLSRLLREYLVLLLTPKGVPSIDDAMRVKWKNSISTYIKQNDEASPFADLPTVERNLINDITSFVDSNDKISVVRKLGELASAIQTREDDMTKIRNINKWSLPLSVVGVVLTVIFGIVSIIK